jgi:hypothetical protein
MEWTAETDAMILALDAEGLTRRAIAERLGVTRNAICGKLHRLKPRRETMPDEPIVDEPTEPLPGPTLGKWWECPPPEKAKEPEIVDESALEELAIALVEAVPLPPPVLPEPPAPSPVAQQATPEPAPIAIGATPAYDATELQRLALKHGFVVTRWTDNIFLLDFLRKTERDIQIAAEYAWQLGELVVVEKDFWGGFFIGGDGKWDRPDPTIGRIDMIKGRGRDVRVNFDTTPVVIAWFKPDDFHRMQRV